MILDHIKIRLCIALKVMIWLVSIECHCTAQQPIFGANELLLVNQKLIEISMEDVYSPPVASRIFMYPNIIAFEVWLHGRQKSVIQANDKKEGIKKSKKIDYSVAAIAAYCQVAKKLVFSEYMIDSVMQRLYAKALASSNGKVSWQYGIDEAASLYAWIDKDNYAQVKSGDFLTISSTDSMWVLTPPNYEQALEPNWSKMRPISVSDVKLFPLNTRPSFSKDPKSIFFQQAQLVVQNSGVLDNEKKKIAHHWDDNPNEFNDSGHNIYFAHKMSPPAHWLNITAILCANNKADFQEALTAHAMITTAMYDGIISCWTIKYKDQLLRPVTYINKYIDPYWQPLIQTPPFPEYTSGHSTISGCASAILAKLFKHTSFVDDTEARFNLGTRHFRSVREAGKEASDSRFYGGIHYKFGVDNGFEQGTHIGNHVYQFLKK